MQRLRPSINRQFSLERFLPCLLLLQVVPIPSLAAVEQPDQSITTPGLKLQLSSELRDVTLAGKISETERAELLERQQLIVVGEQVSYTLSLRRQVQQLQSQLNSLTAQLAQAKIAAPVDISAAPSEAVSSVPVIAPVEVTDSDFVFAKTKESDKVKVWLKFALSLLAAMMFGGLIGRHLVRKKLHQQTLKRRAAGLDEFSKTVIINPKQAAQAETTQSIPALKIPIKETTNLHETDSVVEEAQLYAIHNHPERAINILNELLVDNAKNTRAWLLLLSILSAQNQAGKFERAAQSFLKYNSQGHAWKIIQVLGRTLEADNPLYLDENIKPLKQFSLDEMLSKQPPVGEVLVAMGVLSSNDLNNYLGEFDQKRHGRFGGYLATRRAVTYEQVSEALRLQQSAGEKVQNDAIPILTDSEVEKPS